MPPPTFLMPHSDVLVTSGGREDSPSRTALVPQKSGDDDAVVATGSPNNKPPSPSPADIVPNQEPTDDAVLPSADVHQPPGPDAAESQGSSSTILPSLEPQNTSTPLSAAALNTEQSSESPLDSLQEPKEKSWLTKVKEVVVAVATTITSGGTVSSRSHEENSID
ncbi:hypothetical protein BDZ89DRAFT_671507 [Hymenopellis radicata]|nr:hypothetical protein BDZ89DRAFT_671507 [Hymenopellis radicata]